MNDLAGKVYWEDNQPRRVATLIDVHSDKVRNHAKRELHRYFKRVLPKSEMSTRPALLEIGCGGSLMLPYFNQEFGFRVSGIDYSEKGCTLTRQILLRTGIEADVFCMDAFSMPSELHQQFDVVVSFGVVEHFTDTVGCIRKFMHYLRPGGLMVTSIPNMTGLVGSAQRFFSPAIFEKHVPIDRDTLKRSHRDAGLKVIECSYGLFMYSGVINADNLRPYSAEWFAKMPLFQLLRIFTLGTWLLESAGCRFTPNSLTSPYVRCVALKEVS